MSKLTFYIARHGKTLMNTLDRVQGWCDSPLTETGRIIAEDLGRGLKDITFRSAYCSDLRRTLETIRLILKVKGQEDLPVTEISGFREACFGSFEADFNYVMWGNAALYLHYPRLEEMYKAIFNGELRQSQVLDAVHILDKMGLAENFEQLETRTQNALKLVAEKEIIKGDANILIVAHGMSITAMLYNLGGREKMKDFLDNGAVCKVLYEDGKFLVESMCDMGYIEKGKQQRLDV